MTNVKTSGPHLRQIVLYNDSILGPIPAMITAVSKTTGTITVTTFPPGAAPDFSHSGVSYDFTGAKTGTWRYEEVDYA